VKFVPFQLVRQQTTKFESRSMQKEQYFQSDLNTIFLTFLINILLLLWREKNSYFVSCVESQPQQRNITHTITLSQARNRFTATSSDELVFFGGGWSNK
jgi:hypothetical protein